MILAQDAPSTPLTVLSLQYHAYPDAVGGAWNLTWEVNRRLVQRGFTVHCLTCKPDEKLPGRECIDGIHYYRIRTADSKSLFRLWRGVRRQIHAILKEGPVHIVHIQNPLVGYLALRHPGLKAVPRVYHFHSFWHDEEKINREAKRPQSEWDNLWFDLKLSLSLRAIRRMERAILSASASILFLSEYSRKLYLDRYPAKKTRLRVIPGGVDVEEFRPAASAADKQAIRQELAVPAEAPLILTVRRLEARMGLENLILAAGLLNERNPELEFLVLIAGTGSLQTKLQELIQKARLQDRVRLLGLVPRDTLPYLYRAADVFVLPTTQIEGFGLVTVEALASGIPVLGTPVGGTVEILREIDPGLLFPGTSARDIFQGLERFLKKPEPLLALQGRCREQAESLYSWEKAVDLLEEEFRFTAAK